MAIPLIGGAIIAAGSSLLTWIISRVIAILGIGIVTVFGVQPFLNMATGKILQSLNITAPSWFPIMQWLGLMQLDVCVSILISAVTIKLMVGGLTAGGNLKKVRIGGGD